MFKYALVAFLLSLCTSSVLAEYNRCKARITGLVNTDIYVFSLSKKEGSSPDLSVICGPSKSPFLAMGDIELFCRSTKQCDFVEDYATRLVHQYDFSEGVQYANKLKSAWSECDAEHGRCYYLAEKYLGYHELK